MATVSVRVPDELKAQMEEHPTVNWSAVLREHIRRELVEREERSLAKAVAKSERLSATVDPDEVADVNTADVIREWRDRRYGPD
jgi:ketosteroid isomerase-like protein